MANSMRDTLDGVQGYSISHRPTLAHPLPERDPGQTAAADALRRR